MSYESWKFFRYTEIDVSCLHWSKSKSNIFVSDVCVRARRYMQQFPRTWTSEVMKRARSKHQSHLSHGYYQIWSKMAVASGDLGSEPRM